MKIIVDAMGGDFAPLAPVKGALMAQEKYGVDIVLTGKTEEILKALQQCGCKELPKGMEIANATEVVEICDDPATAFKHKKDSSLTVGLNMLHAGDADGFVSAGSTGALLAGATLVVKRIRGLRRAALAPTIPTAKGKAVLIDCGANAECTVEYLLQFAYLGSYYAQKVLGVENPRIGLLNIGAEESKGDTLRRETYQKLKEAGEAGHLNFTGNIEAKEHLIKVMREGEVEGNINCRELIIDGRVHGQCRGDSITIEEHGNIDGTLAYRALAIKKGGLFTGSAEVLAAAGAKSNIIDLAAEAPSAGQEKHARP